MFNPISKLVVWLSLLRRDVWAGTEFERDGMPCILRFRPEYPLRITQFDYRFLVHIKWAYVPGRHNGMPSERDIERMFLFEKKLKTLELGRIAFLMATCFCNSVTEWLWYARDNCEVLEIIDKWVCELDGCSIEISTNEEGDWGAYYSLVPEKWLMDYRTQVCS